MMHYLHIQALLLPFYMTLEESFCLEVSTEEARGECLAHMCYNSLRLITANNQRKLLTASLCLIWASMKLLRGLAQSWVSVAERDLVRGGR